MTQNRIIALAFEPQDFPLSPHYESLVAYADEDENAVVFVGGDKAPDIIDDHISVFYTDEEGYVPSLPDGTYVVKMSLGTGADKFKIQCDFINQEQREITHTCVVDAKDYLDSYTRAFNDAAIEGNTPEAIEANFSIPYLKKALGDVVSGNEAFWQRIFGDLDMASATLNFAISLENEGKPCPPIRVENADRAPQPKGWN
jgi:hypothetical protein